MDQPVPPPERVTPEKGRGPGSKIANSLVALGSAAVLTVYAAGYLKTRSAAARFAVEAADLRTEIPPGATAGPPSAEAPGEFVDAGKPVEATPSVPASPAPNGAASAPPSRIVSAETSPAPTVDSVESAGPKGPAPQPASSQPAPAPAEEPAQASAEPTPSPAPADVDSAKTEPPAPPAAPRQGQYKDGTFAGWGYSRHGDIEAAVVVQDGRVVSAEITQCLTRYSCSVIDMLPAQVLDRQNPFVDLISGATESAVAYSNAIFRALKRAK